MVRRFLAMYFRSLHLADSYYERRSRVSFTRKRLILFLFQTPRDMFPAPLQFLLFISRNLIISEINKLRRVKAALFSLGLSSRDHLAGTHQLMHVRKRT